MVSGVNSNFILQLGQDSRIWTEVQYILLPNKRDYQKQGRKKKERESSKSQEHVGLIPRNMLLKVTFLEPPIYLFVNKPVKIRSLQGPAPCLRSSVVESKRQTGSECCQDRTHPRQHSEVEATILTPFPSCSSQWLLLG